jgi:hypothetical protein
MFDFVKRLVKRETGPQFKMGDKLYIVVREDLTPGQKACMAVHAMREYTQKFPANDAAWYRDSNFVCLLEAERSDVEHYLPHPRPDVPVAVYREPDLGDKIVAVALGPGEIAQKICKGYKLALRSNK